ncbi:MAG TPA: tetratricopeptide repeat protein [Thermomicrobiales bacterium]|nr:tetratricopeptide repeat protein [Thermomicrobiales bacterium]
MSPQPKAPVPADGVPHTPSKSRLPAPLTPLVGRTDELAWIAASLNDPGTRLLVLTGPGGVGKTRLAIAVAHQVAGSGARQIVMVHLAQVASDDDVLPAIAQRFGIRTLGNDSPVAVVIDALRDVEVLLVLDNFEHVTGAAPVLGELLANCGGLTILVTSRSLLDIYGEIVFPVPPLSLPPTVDASFESISTSDAVRLFVSRVQAMQPGFSLSQDNAEDIATICARLDGLPLAIELAAARTRHFSIPQLADRLVRRLPMLDDTPGHGPDRLRTLRRAIAWSYELLPPLEQGIFRQLAIFDGTWTLDIARQMVFPGSGDDGLMEIAALVGSLVDKSLVQRSGIVNDDQGFLMLQTIREFARDALVEAGEWETVASAHAGVMLETAERAEPHLMAGDQVWWLNYLDMLLGDLRAASSYFMSAGMIDRALRLAIAIWRFASTRGHVPEVLSLLEQALDRPSASLTVRARALNAAGVLSNAAGDMDMTRHYHDEALTLARSIGDRHSQAIANTGLGDVAALSQDHDVADAAYEEAGRLYAEIDDRRGVATIQTNLGNSYWVRGRVAEAIDLNESARRLYESVGDQRGVAWSYTNIGRFSAGQGDWDRAISNLGDALRLYDVLGDRPGIAEALEGFAVVASDLRHAVPATHLLAAADRIRHDASHPVPLEYLDSWTHLRASLQATLGQDFDDQWARGADLPVDEAIGLALGIGDLKPASDVERSPDTRNRTGLTITNREMDVLQLLGEGKSDKEIAESLFISVKTVRTHVQRLFAKFETSSRTGIISRAFREGLLS